MQSIVSENPRSPDGRKELDDADEDDPSLNTSSSDTCRLSSPSEVASSSSL